MPVSPGMRRRVLHILFVLDTWGLIGGTERHAAVVVPALLARGHRVTVLCRADRAPTSRASVWRAQRSRACTSALARRELRGTLRALAPDVVFHSALRNVDAAEGGRGPVVRYVHDHTVFCGLNKYRQDGGRDPMGGVPGLISCARAAFASPASFAGGARGRRPAARQVPRARVAQGARTVLTNSPLCAASSAGRLPPGARPSCTTHALEHARSAPGPAARGDRALSPPRTPAALHPGAADVARQGRRLPDHGPRAPPAPFRAVVAGSGPAEGWLRERRAPRDSASGCTGLARLGRHEALYARADAIVCPSVWDEPFGLVGIEATRKPVVAFRVGGIPVVPDGETGFLVERKDSDDGRRPGAPARGWRAARASRRARERACRQRFPANARRRARVRARRGGGRFFPQVLSRPAVARAETLARRSLARQLGGARLRHLAQLHQRRRATPGPRAGPRGRRPLPSDSRPPGGGAGARIVQVLQRRARGSSITARTKSGPMRRPIVPRWWCSTTEAGWYRTRLPRRHCDQHQSTSSQ